MADLTELIDQCIEAKTGNKEFALFYFGEASWRAEIGNTCAHVTLGEQEGEFRGEGNTKEEAVKSLLQAVRQERGTHA